MNDIERQQLKRALDDASDALNELGFFMSHACIDMRNVTREIQAKGAMSLSDLEEMGKSLKLKSEAAIEKVRGVYKLAGKHYGGGR
jgi:hypothetical protein